MHNLYEAIPFLGVILSISMLPLISSTFWHRHARKVLAFWIIAFSAMEIHCFGVTKAFAGIFESVIKHYIPFVLLVASLYITTGGIFVDFHKLRPSPMTNTMFLFCGSIVAGWIGTTGASALLIRPFLRLNEARKSRVHLVIFFIFLVSNIGGVASPIGDPPLFMGYLEGVDFFWFIKHLFWYLIAVISAICVIFYVVDKIIWAKDDYGIVPKKIDSDQTITILGKRNILFVFLILLCLVLCNFDGGVTILGTEIKYSSLLRDSILVIISLLSIKLSSKIVRQRNEFSYDPIIEVAETFIAIFITVSPLLEMLALGKDGPLSSIFNAVSPHGSLDPVRCFWTVGCISSFLDNAPTFLIFFFLAGGNAIDLMTTNATYLMAISMAAVFMGATTYIGNAPNIMMRSIAEASGITMPSFFKYMGISIITLVPIFFILSMVL